MFQRPRFWLGLLLGSAAAFGSLIGSQKRRSAYAQAACPKAIFDFSLDALIVWDRAGAITQANPAAQKLFGPQCVGLSTLCYPNGQSVPPGQLPLSRVLRTDKSVTNETYCFTAADGAAHILVVSARPLPGGGAAALFRDATVLHGSQECAAQAQARQETMHLLGRRLSVAVTAEATGRIVVESARALLGGMAGTQVRLYSYDSMAQTVTRTASDPDDRPKWPKSSAQALLPTFPFDARIPALWQLYVDRQPTALALAELGEDSAAAVYALPLLSGGAAIGHLSLASSASGAFDDPVLLQALDILASLAALALAGPQAAERNAVLTAQAEAIREVACAAAVGMESGCFADLITAHIRLQIPCEVCTLSVLIEGKLSVLGKAFQDDLLFPERLTPADPVLHGKAVQKAWRTQKSVTQLGIVNPSFDAGLWRGFAGKSGRHSILAMPLASHLGVLTVYTQGDSPLPEAQVKFVETLAALASVALRSASVSEAHADC